MTDPAVAGFSGNVSQYQVRTITHLPHLSTLTTPSVFLFQKNLVPKKEFIPKNNVLVLQKKDLIWLLLIAKKFGVPDNSLVFSYTGNVHAANTYEVRSLYLAVAILNREGQPAVLIRTGRDFCNFLGDDGSD